MLTALIRPMTKDLALEIVTRRYATLNRLRSRCPINDNLIRDQSGFCGEAIINARRYGATQYDINVAIAKSRTTSEVHS